MKKVSSVLLVDDDATNNFLNELLFRQLGTTDHLHTAEDGAQTLEIVVNAANPDVPALILLDVNST